MIEPPTGEQPTGERRTGERDAGDRPLKLPDDRRLLAAAAALIALVFVAGLLVGGALRLGGSATGEIGALHPSTGIGRGGIQGAGPTARPTPIPTPGHEVYGFLPYWEMDATIAAEVAQLDLTTLALFSITSRTDGTLDTTQNGYKRISGPVGQALVAAAHDRGMRVELVYSSFGTARNRRLFSGAAATKTQGVLIDALVALVGQLQLDGVNVDVEQIDDVLIPAYGDFVGRLRGALRAAHAASEVAVATNGNEHGAAMALAASTAGADRIFLMGYDYHWSGSDPGASAPIQRRDGDERNLAWSLDLYQAFGVPAQRTILGLPLYGMAWPVVGPQLGAAQTGKGTTWVPSDHLAFLQDAANVATIDPIEQVEVFIIPPGGGSSVPASTAGSGSTGPAGSSSPGASSNPAGSSAAGGWTAIYVDSPTTLAPKLALADARGLAGAGFWAIGYERGQPAYADLVKRFHDGQLGRP